MGSIALDVLRCAGCRSGGLRTGQATVGAQKQATPVLECPACLCAYPVLADVPVMMQDVTAVRAPLLDPGAARDVLAQLGLPADPFATLRVRRASGARARRAQGILPEDGRVLGKAVPATAGGGGPGCTWLAEHLPSGLRAGAEVLATVRLRNSGAGMMPCAGPGRVTVAAIWRDLDGQPVATQDIRTPLPVDILPGMALSFPVWLKAPDACGRYRLSLALVQEGLAWLDPVLSGPVIRVEDHFAGFVPPAHWVLDGPGEHGAAPERARGIAALQGWLAGRERPLVLEVGGGADPAVAALGLGCVNLDGDLLALQLGRLRDAAGKVLPVCAEMTNMPLAAGRFDAVACFGAMHRAEDMTAALRAVAALLAPGGFVALSGEPVGHVWPGSAGPELLAALRRGENEQRFSLAEWAGSIAAAGLRAAELVVTGGLLSARLVREGVDA